MFIKDILFWNVDTQVDFMDKDGKLYVPYAERIQPVLKKLTELAVRHNIQVVNTADYHYPGSKELSTTPNFVHTFPEHCMANTAGAEYVEETKPERDFYEVFWNREYSDKELANAGKYRNIIIRKDAFDVFEGNPNTDNLLKKLAPKKVFVYGVTTNVCVNCAAIGLAKRNLEVYVLEDAVKELPNIPLPFENWDRLRIKRIQFGDLENLLV